MAEIPRAALEYVTDQVNALSSDAQARVLRVLESIEWTSDNVAECRDTVVRALASVMPAYTDAAAQASADFYDAARAMATGEMLGAKAYSSFDPQLTDSAIRAFAQRIVDGKPVESFNDAVLQRIDYEIKRASGDCIVENAAVDPLRPRYARVPTGPETCLFCLMLASRGAVYRSEASAGAVDHYHANCNCRVVPDFDGTDIEGYDPDELADRWEEGMDALARERAERNGTTEEEEYSKIYTSYQESAKRAHRRARQQGRTRSRSAYRGEVDGKRIGSFSDVRDYVFSADSMAELERRRDRLAELFGEDSPQMRSGAMGDLFRHMEKRLPSTGNPNQIVGEGFTARRSVGAKSVNDYVIHMPNGGEDSRFFPDSEVDVREVFAGPGSDPERELRVRSRLSEEYGGDPDQWTHVAGRGWMFDPDDNGKIKRAEVHWMEYPDPEIGRVEFWFKEWVESD